MDDQANIKVSKDGPYLVYGGLPLGIETIGTNSEGGSWTWDTGPAVKAPEQYALCRCGQSTNKPFCDGSHKRVGFDGTETASREPFEREAEATDGPTMTLYDDRPLCAYARFCDNAGTIWTLIERTDDKEVRRIVSHEATHCPSGRLVVRDRDTGEVVEPQLTPSISLVEDPAMQCSGPLWVRGGVRVESADGQQYEIRNRVTLCRCGASQNKPFCDGSHADIGFNDGLTK
ncbi:MAG TPA: CDGSH iron-sulfur domain-containing protein [Candidatus Eremiobacteraceae bacterium]|nr:CDGSH iron-sulfur domain-containing protein [Candidatus Eremiobacteraceae bacterium]